MIEKFLSHATSEIAGEVKPNRILFIRKQMGSEEEEEVPINLQIIDETDGRMSKKSETLEVKRLPPSSITQVREIIVEAINQDILSKNEKIFCITDESLGRGFEGLFFILETDEEFMKLTRKGLEEDLEEGVLDSVISIAKDLSRKGREGKPVGTAFIIGDHENVIEKSKQLVINPFDGTPLDERNISDTMIRETVKEFAQIDGVFIIDDEGFIRSAGAYLNVDTSNVSFPGMGARHHASSAITERTDAKAVCVSTDGLIRVFKDGNLIMEEEVK